MPGLRHVVTHTYKPETTDEQLAAIVDALRALPAQIDAIAGYEVGLDAGLADGNATLAIVADFASVEDYETYRDHPAHQQVIAERIIDHIAGRSAIQHHR